MDLGADRVAALSVFSLGGDDVQSHLLAECSGDEPAHGMRLPPSGVHGDDKQMHLRRRVSQYVSA
jgi:hypothetical protein